MLVKFFIVNNDYCFSEISILSVLSKWFLSIFICTNVLIVEILLEKNYIKFFARNDSIMTVIYQYWYYWNKKSLPVIE